MKKSLLPVLTFVMFALAGCATQRPIDQGTVINVEKIAGRSYAPHSSTAVGAGTGATVGATAGAVTGGLLGMTFTVGTFGLAAPMIPSLVAGGALLGGGMGAAAGGTAGYAAGLYEQGSGVYEFTIKPDNKSENLTVTQYMKKPVHLHDRVSVYLKNGHLELKKL